MASSTAVALASRSSWLLSPPLLLLLLLLAPAARAFTRRAADFGALEVSPELLEVGLALPHGQRRCGYEVELDDVCRCDGAVKFGYWTRWSEWKNISHDGEISCKSEVFGDPVPGIAKVCICQPRVYTCATEYSTPQSNCSECTMGNRCSCAGSVRFGYGDRWTDWRATSGRHVECSPEVFGDPAVGQGKVCQCMLSPKVLDRITNASASGGSAAGSAYAPYGSVINSIVVITVCYFVVYGALAALRGLNQVFWAYTAGTAERVLLAGTSAVYLAPMLCALLFAVTKRAESLTRGKPFEYDYPPTYLKSTAAVCAATFCLQVLFHILAEWVVARHHSEADQPGAPQTQAARQAALNKSTERLRLWTVLCGVAVAAMYGCVLVVIVGVVHMEEPSSLQEAEGQSTISPGTICTIVMAIANVVVHLILHCLKTRDRVASLSCGGGTAAFSSFGTEVISLAATAMNFAPMLSAVFMGVQIAADWRGAGLGDALEVCMFACTFAVLAQVVLVLLTPFLSNAELEVTGSRGEVNIVARNRGAFVMISFVRWAAMLALYAGVLVLCLRLWVTKAAPALTHLLGRLAFMYFASYLALWVAITGRLLMEGGLLRIIRIMTVVKDTVAFCPMLAILALASFVRARHFINGYGESGVPQGYVQDSLYVSLLALAAQLLMTLLSGALARTPVSAATQLDAEEKRGDIFTLFLAIYYVATGVLYLSVVIVIYGLFAITPANAHGHGRKD